MSFKQHYGEIKAQVEQELAQFFNEQIESAKQKDEVLVEMVEVLKEFCLRGGKRVRPLLVVLAYEYAKSVNSRQETVDSGQETVDSSVNKTNSTPSPHISGPADSMFSPQMKGDDWGGDILRLACAVETHHHFLLALDDVVDRDEVRHGGPTLELTYRQKFTEWTDQDHHGRSLSSIASALLNSFTFKLLSQANLSASQFQKILRIITDQLFADTVVGWQIHYFQNHDTLAESSEERFLKGLEYVTSRYTFVGPLQIGLVAAGVGETSAPHLSGATPSPHLSGAFALESSPKGRGELERVFEEYGKHVGMAMQIKDDIMGLFGDPKVMGKAVGNDIREGKKTLLLQRAYRNSSTGDQQFLADVCGREMQQGELARVQQIVKESGSLDYSMQLAQEHVNNAITQLDLLPVQNEYTQILKELAEYMVKREK